MGLDYHFYAQFRRSDEWVVPPELAETLGDFRPELGYVVWFNQSDPGFRRVFLGDSALVPLRRTQPDSIESTELFSRHTGAWDEWYAGYLGLEELMLDSWPQTSLHVSLQVEARLAHAFADGDQPFPEGTLLALGVSQSEVENMTHSRQRRFVDSPVRNVPRRSDFVEVTWKNNLVQLLTEWRYLALLGLRNFGDDEDIRIICHHC